MGELVLIWAAVAWAKIPTHCEWNEECLVEVPASYCADKTPSFITLVKRPGAENLLILLHGGGACWDKKTCKQGLANPLTRVERPTDWNTGKGIFSSSDPANPFRSQFNIITIPYCTGDAFMGSRVAKYESLTIAHLGYGNVEKSLDQAAKLYPRPNKVVLIGQSAGGLGTLAHLSTLASRFPYSAQYVIDDSGTPFKPPHIELERYKAVMATWGAEKLAPAEANHLGGMISENNRLFPETRFALIATYHDQVMTFFSHAVGSPHPDSAVYRTLRDVFANDMATAQSGSRAYFTNGAEHVLTGESLSKIAVRGKTLSSWLYDMIHDSPDWKNTLP